MFQKLCIGFTAPRSAYLFNPENETTFEGWEVQIVAVELNDIILKSSFGRQV
jgi:hypothetical protein